MQMAIPRTSFFRHAIILVAAIEVLFWLLNAPWILGLSLFGIGQATARQDPVGIFVIIPIIVVLLVSVASLVLAIKDAYLGVSAALAILAAVLWIVL